VAPKNQPIGKENQKKIHVPEGALQKGVDRARVTTELTVVTNKDHPSFATEELTVKPGEIVRLTVKNNSSQRQNQYQNWVLTKPNKVAEMDIAGRHAGPQQGWVPISPDVLAHTRLLAPGETDTIVFRAPSEPGDYPYVSTFPGQARNPGTLHVKKG
jgi:azurin